MLTAAITTTTNTNSKIGSKRGVGTGFTRLAGLCFLIALLPACSILENSTSARSGGVGSAQATNVNPAVSRSTQISQVAIPTIGNTNSVEQQQLLSEINRDGQAIDYPGFRETVPAPVQVEGDDVVELNHEQADLRLVLEELADALDISIIIDPTIDDKISIRTSPNRPLQRDDIWPLIRLLTRDAGIFLEQVGDIYNARKVNSNLPVEIVTPATLGTGTAARVMQITPLTYVAPEAVIQAIEPLLEPDGRISRISNSSLLAISGSEFQLRRINQLLLLIDADPFVNQGIHLYQLSNANAVEVAEELDEILLLIEGANPAYQVRGIERINAILVTAPATRGFDEISRWVRILDAASQEQVEQLFMYRVKNLVATELADTLSSVFEEDDDRIQGLGEQDGLLNQLIQPVSEGESENQSSANGAVAANLTVKIVADEATNSLLIRSTARDYRQLLTTISQLDVVPLQVMVNAVIAQVTLTDDTRFGINWSRVASDANLNSLASATSSNFTPDLGGLMFSKAFLDGSHRVDVTLDAIAENNEVNLLARPSLTVSNNQEGEIQIGADVPVEAGQSISTGGLSTTNIQYRPTGIELYITPQINSDGIINLIIRQVLSSVDRSQTGVNNNPVFNNQEISTTVVVRDGENVVLGGLIQTEMESLNTGVPGLNRLPLVGRLFSYQRNSVIRKELFIVLRPEIINLNAEAGVQYSDILDRFELASVLLDKAGL